MRADATANRAALLRAASRLVPVLGADVSADEIAAEAGVGRSTLYRHFPTRDRLLEESALHAWRRFARELERSAGRSGGRLADVREATAAIAGFAVSAQPWLAATGQELGRTPVVLVTERKRVEREFAVRWQLAREAGALRPDFEAADVFAFAMGSTSPERWHRQVELIFEGLRARPDR